jgi:hypothetical protein
MCQVCVYCFFSLVYAGEIFLNWLSVSISLWVKQKTALFKAIYWWGRVVMDVRKIFEETEEYIYIPDLANLAL